MSRYLAIVALLALAGCSTVLAPIQQIQQAKLHVATAALDVIDRDSVTAQPIFEASGNKVGVECAVGVHETATNLKRIAAMPQDGLLSKAAALDAAGRALKRSGGIQSCSALCVENRLFCPFTEALLRALAVLP